MSILKAISLGERALFLRLNLLSFILLASYGLAQPTCQSLFVSAYGSRGLPWAWLGVTCVSVGTVVAVSRLSTHLPLWRMLQITSAVSALVLALLLAADRAGLPHAVFVLYIWKDVYIVVLVELFWTFANLAFGAEQARTTYGWFCATGTMGGMAGSFFAANMATRWGTHNVLWTAVPMLCIAIGEARAARGVTAAPGSQVSAAPPPPRPAWRQAPAFLRQSPFVGWLILLVGVVQASMTVMDFQFNQAAQTYCHDTDGLTAMMGKVQGGINVASLVLQVATGSILRLLGLAGTLMIMPLALMATLMAFVWAPGLVPIIAAKVVGKSSDYSLFRAAKEMLYIPLSYTEKTFGKALVDILVYRVAKGGVSLILLALVGLHSDRAIGVVSVVLCGLWVWVTWRLLRVYRHLLGGESGGRAASPQGLGLLLALGVGASLWATPGAAWGRGEDPYGVGPSFTKPDLYVHPAGADLSAARLDTEVFGWNKTFTEVAAVGSDVLRGPRGKHRGEVYMLVYRISDGRLLHNVITHNITHPDLPHNPIPMDDVRDLTWTIENPYQNMWPVRPHYSRPKTGATVKTLWASVPAGTGAAGAAKGAADELCTPFIGAHMAWKSEHRLVNLTAVDMTVSCALLKRGDERVYWGRDDVAAVMARFDYNNLPNNEKSARFVHSLVWGQGVSPKVALVGEIHSAAAVADLRRLMPYAQIDADGLRVGNPLATALLQVSAQAPYTALAYHLRDNLLRPEAEVVAEVTPQAPPAVGAKAALPELILRLGDPSWRPPPPPDPDHPGTGLQHRPPHHALPPSRTPPQGDYLRDWRPP